MRNGQSGSRKARAGQSRQMASPCDWLERRFRDPWRVSQPGWLAPAGAGRGLVVKAVRGA